MSDDVEFAAKADCLVGTYRGLKREIAKKFQTPRMTPDDFWELLQHERKLRANQRHRR